MSFGVFRSRSPTAFLSWTTTADLPFFSGKPELPRVWRFFLFFDLASLSFFLWQILDLFLLWCGEPSSLVNSSLEEISPRCDFFAETGFFSPPGRDSCFYFSLLWRNLFGPTRLLKKLGSWEAFFFCKRKLEGLPLQWSSVLTLLSLSAQCDHISLFFSPFSEDQNPIPPSLRIGRGPIFPCSTRSPPLPFFPFSSAEP